MFFLGSYAICQLWMQADAIFVNCYYLGKSIPQVIVMPVMLGKSMPTSHVVINQL